MDYIIKKKYKKTTNKSLFFYSNLYEPAYAHHDAEVIQLRVVEA
jgi:hypothetical protein